jgi:hypothetical protein
MGNAEARLQRPLVPVFTAVQKVSQNISTPSTALNLVETVKSCDFRLTSLGQIKVKRDVPLAIIKIRGDVLLPANVDTVSFGILRNGKVLSNTIRQRTLSAELSDFQVDFSEILRHLKKGDLLDLNIQSTSPASTVVPMITVGTQTFSGDGITVTLASFYDDDLNAVQTHHQTLHEGNNSITFQSLATNPNDPIGELISNRKTISILKSGTYIVQYGLNVHSIGGDSLITVYLTKNGSQVSSSVIKHNVGSSTFSFGKQFIGFDVLVGDVIALAVLVNGFESETVVLRGNSAYLTLTLS